MKTLLMMSLTGGALALVVMGLRAVLGRKLHPRLIYLLWLLVVVWVVAVTNRIRVLQTKLLVKPIKESWVKNCGCGSD
jgi:beta-lactamase regulating signal transducer with metallopeptidase domain